MLPPHIKPRKTGDSGGDCPSVLSATPLGLRFRLRPFRTERGRMGTRCFFGRSERVKGGGQKCPLYTGRSALLDWTAEGGYPHVILCGATKLWRDWPMLSRHTNPDSVATWVWFSLFARGLTKRVVALFISLR